MYESRLVSIHGRRRVIQPNDSHREASSNVLSCQRSMMRAQDWKRPEIARSPPAITIRLLAHHRPRLPSVVDPRTRRKSILSIRKVMGRLGTNHVYQRDVRGWVISVNAR